MPPVMSIRQSVRERGRRLFHVSSATGFSRRPGDAIDCRFGIEKNSPRGPAPGPNGVHGVRVPDRMTTKKEPKFHAASQAQREEIMRHCERLSQCRGRAVGLDEAARDWISSYAADWRARFEAEWRESAPV